MGMVVTNISQNFSGGGGSKECAGCLIYLKVHEAKFRRRSSSLSKPDVIRAC